MNNKKQVTNRQTSYKNQAMNLDQALVIIGDLEAENERLKQDCIDLVDLGTDQVVTEKIVRLEKENAILLDAINYIEFNLESPKKIELKIDTTLEKIKEVEND